MSSLPAAVVHGFLVSLALIVAIGAQNAFVLRQGLRGEHALAVALFCAACDALLITLGVYGAGWLGARLPLLEQGLRWGGAAFLAAYGLLALRRAWQGSAGLQAAGGARQALAAVLGQAAAFTLLNPHVYLDTVLVVGSQGAAQPPGALRAGFVAGASTASLLWFLLIGLGSRRLTPWLARPALWRALDAAIGLLMLGLAVALLC